MKKLYKSLLFSALALGLAACDFETENYQQIPSGSEYQTVQDVQNGMHGAYYALGSYRFLGNYAVAYGDFCAGISDGSSSSGHFYSQSNWIIDETTGETADIWQYGFQVIDRCTRTIAGAQKVLADESLHLTAADEAEVNLYVAQCYAMKALANYYLVNLFAYPYSAGTDNLGLPLVKDEPIEAFETIDRSTVGETYTQITDDIAAAEAALDAALAGGASDPGAFYMGAMGIEALKARVYMSMGRYADAETAAKNAIRLKGTGDGTGSDNTPNKDAYLSMWTSLAVTDEDLFTIAKNESDNLSANALNTLYGSYLCTLSNYTLGLYDDADYRLELVSRPSIGKYQGLSTSAATSNIPIFRKSEMSLIIAEVEARIGTISEAQKYLYYTAKRNEAITGADQLPDNTADLLAFISDERVREFAGEGHRFYDARRMGDQVELAISAQPFDIAKFVFPIPADEINAGFCTQQNEGWSDALPQ